MAAEQMKELLKHELGDLLFAEQTVLKMLGTLDREVSDPELSARMQEHVAETEGQIERLKRAFESIGEKAKAEKCPGILGLKEEHDSYKKEEKPSKPQLEAFDLGTGLRVEHYEIAAYRTAIAVATAMGESECVRLLTESLREEEAMASFLERSAVKALKALNERMEPRDVAFTPAAKSPSRGAAAKSGSKSAAAKSSSKSGGAAKSASKSAAKTSSRTSGEKSATKSAAKKSPARKTSPAGARA